MSPATVPCLFESRASAAYVVVGDERGVEQQAPDQRRFAVVDRSAGEHAKLIAAEPEGIRRDGFDDRSAQK